MKVFFDQRMSVDSGGYSPSGSKPGLCVADWQQRNLDIEICGFHPVTESELCLAHSPDYVRGVLSGQIQNGHGNRIPAVTRSTLWTCGSMIAASRAALIDGIACSPSSGFHHACYGDGGGFCTWNSLVISALKLIGEGLVTRVGIIDCDQHFGDGTADIIAFLRLEDAILHWTFGEHYGYGTFIQSDFLQDLQQQIDMMRDAGVGLIIYQAGADVHIDDPLGGTMTSEEMRERDRFVFESCRDLHIPVAYCHAGGYTRDENGGISGVIALHRTTLTEAISACRR